jgi:PAT family beta-lactamase induction signal transducer AmpG
LADILGWHKTYLLMACGMVIGILTSILAPKVKDLIHPTTLESAVIEPFKQFFSRNGAWIILLFILFYKLGDQMATDLLNPFYLDLGFTKIQIGLLGKNFGLGAMIAGGLIGGLLLIKWGIYRSLWIFGFLQAFAILTFTLLLQQASLIMLAAVITIENLASGMAGASYAAYMASLCDKRYTATQYALFSSLIGVTRVFFVSGDGWLVKHLGWGNFFILSTLLAVPGFVLLWRLSQMDKTLKMSETTA